jgi:type 1 glutamine amidotransferase
MGRSELMMLHIRTLLTAIVLLSAALTTSAQKPFRVLALYSKNVEADHVQFAEQAIRFYTTAAASHGYEFVASARWDDLNAATLAHYQVVLWLNDSPHTNDQRKEFETYMSHGGAWLGFHAAGYNDSSTHWPWFVDFLGGAVFYSNSWPPLPAKLRIDDPAHPVTKGLGSAINSPANEWYIWTPSPRLNPHVKVLLTLDPSNYPIGLKDVLGGGDLPVVWTNTAYRMAYMNMGHGDKIFDNPQQNSLFIATLLWLVSKH